MSDYAKGFKDGFAAGLEEGKKLAPKPTRLDDYVFGQPNICSVCKVQFNGPMGYVCTHPSCPSRVTSVGLPLTAGAAGAEFKPEDYHPDWIGKWSEDRDRGR